MPATESERLPVVIPLVLLIPVLGCVPPPPTPDLTVCQGPGVADDGVAATYYVAAAVAGASDSNDGLSQTYEGGTRGPWRTVAHAAAGMRAGDTTLVRPGTYAETNIQFCHSGTAAAPIVLSGAGADQVIIDGAAGPASHGIIIGPQVGHITLEGLTVQNLAGHGIVAGLVGDTRRAGRIVIRNLHVRNYGGGNSPTAVAGVILYNVDDFSLTNLETSNGGFSGVQLVGCTNGTVANSTFYGNPAPLANGLEIMQGHDITVSNCVAYDNAGYGFDVSLWPKVPPFAYNITIQECFAYDNRNAGFAVNSRSHDVVFRRNIAWRNCFASPKSPCVILRQR